MSAERIFAESTDEHLPPNLVLVREVESFWEAAELMDRHGSYFPLIDLDNTLRDQLNTVKTLRVGEIPYAAFEYMHEMLLAGKEFRIITDQYQSGFFGTLARTMSRLRGGYPFFPDTLFEAIGEERILGRTPDAPGNKLSQARIDRVIHHITKYDSMYGVNIVPVVGDRDKDGLFARKIAESLPEMAVEFYKMPDPFYVVRNERVREVMNKVLP